MRRTLAYIITVLGLAVAGAVADVHERLVFIGRASSGGGRCRGPSPHEGWDGNAAGRDAWWRGGGGLGV
jgi:hypothetical protein